MRKVYLTPTTEMIFTVNDELMVVVSGATGQTDDGTIIGDGGDDGTVNPSIKGTHDETFGNLW